MFYGGKYTLVFTLTYFPRFFLFTKKCEKGVTRLTCKVNVDKKNVVSRFQQNTEFPVKIFVTFILYTLNYYLGIEMICILRRN